MASSKPASSNGHGTRVLDPFRRPKRISDQPTRGPRTPTAVPSPPKDWAFRRLADAIYDTRASTSRHAGLFHQLVGGFRLAAGVLCLCVLGCGELTQDRYVFYADPSVGEIATAVAIEVRNADGDIVLPLEARALSTHEDGRVATLVLAPEDSNPARGYQIQAQLLARDNVIARLPLITESYEQGSTREFESTFQDERCFSCSDVAIGQEVSCLQRAGDVFCFGNNVRHSIGAEDVGAQFAQVDIDDVLSVGAGWSRSQVCAVRGDQRLSCWGGGGDTPWLPSPASEFPEALYADVFVRGTVCAFRLDGALGCTGPSSNPFRSWGHNEGNLNVGPYAEVALSQRSGCGIMADDGSLQCWGLNTLGDLGVGDTDPIPLAAPIAVPTTDRIVSVSVSGRHSCFVTDSGRLYCAGDNSFGQLGRDAPRQSSEWLEVVVADERFVQVAAGGTSGAGDESGFTCAITFDQALYCWGYNARGELGVGDLITRSTPTRVDGRWRLVRAGPDRACAFDLDDTPFCWGNNRHQRLGFSTGDESIATAPGRVMGLPPLGI